MSGVAARSTTACCRWPRIFSSRSSRGLFPSYFLRTMACDPRWLYPLFGHLRLLAVCDCTCIVHEHHTSLLVVWLLLLHTFSFASLLAVLYLEHAHETSVDKCPCKCPDGPAFHLGAAI